MGKGVNIAAMKAARAADTNARRESRPQKTGDAAKREDRAKEAIAATRFIRRCKEVLDEVDDLPTRAGSFAESVREKVEGMMEWAEEKRRVTERMTESLENMSEGVAKWHRR